MAVYVLQSKTNPELYLDVYADTVGNIQNAEWIGNAEDAQERLEELQAQEPEYYDDYAVTKVTLEFARFF